MAVLDEIILEDISKVKSIFKGDRFEQKKVLITGGAGFIGSWLSDIRRAESHFSVSKSQILEPVKTRIIFTFFCKKVDNNWFL
jgi:hypothetical protein